jgi:hypothetical protein
MALTLTRRRLLQSSIAGGLAVGLSAHWPAVAGPAAPADLAMLAPTLRTLRDSFHALARKWTDANQLARPDGYFYSVDAAQLMICFAQLKDQQGYAALHKHAVDHLIRNEPTEPYTQGFVSWRYKPDEKLDASGTTEALRLARALWLGAKSFDKPQDRARCALVLAGYSRHAMVDQGVWIIRNYFGFATHSFATNSFLVDYDADFVKEVADAQKDTELAKVAENSYAAVKMAVAPSGLIYDLLQPELKTLYPELDVVAFSPNDIIQFCNCCTTANTIAKGLPNIARRLLAFALNRLDDLRVFYYGRSGQPVNDRPASLAEFSALARLALLLNDAPSAATIARASIPKWQYFSEHAEPSQAYLVSEILMALNALLDANAGR